jgi:hypothetical protein
VKTAPQRPQRTGRPLSSSGIDAGVLQEVQIPVTAMIDSRSEGDGIVFVYAAYSSGRVIAKGFSVV